MPKPTKATPAAKKTVKAVAKTASKSASKAATKASAPARATTSRSVTTKAPAKKAAAAAKGETTTAAKATATAKTTTRKSTKKPPLDKFLLEQQELLQKERTRLLQQADALKAEADQLAEEMEPGDVQFDEESGEGGTMNVERERDLALSAQARAEVEDIDEALAKIDAGTYGVCERCGQPIAKARLKAIPQAALCVPCKSGGLLRR
jgi:DnaK suppressor protein